MLRPVVGILTGHTQVQRRLSLMGLSNDPFCSYWKEAVESASHYLPLQLLCSLTNNSMGKTQFTPDRYRFSDSGGYCEVYQKISQILIKYPVTIGSSQGMADGPTSRSKSTGRCNKRPAPFGTWNLDPGPAGRPRTTWMSQIVRDTDSLLLTHGLSPTTGQHGGGHYDPQPVTRSSE